MTKDSSTRSPGTADAGDATTDAQSDDASTGTSIRRTTAGRLVYAGMVTIGLVFVSTLVLPVTAPIARTVATVAFGLMSGLWLATLLYEVGRQTAATGAVTFDWLRLVRLYTMIATVSGVSLFVFAGQFSGTTLSLLYGAVGAIAVVSAILGALVAGASYIGGGSNEKVIQVVD